MATSAPIRSPLLVALLTAVLAACVPPTDLDTGAMPGADAGPGESDADLGEPEPDADPGEVEPDADAAEEPADTELVPVPASRPAIAAGASAYLTAWTDERGADDDIYVGRVDADGLVLDVGGIALSTQAGDESTPAVAHDGAQYLVVWVDRRGGGSAIYGARVADDGSVLDPGGLRISPAGDVGLQKPAVASTGDGFLVVYEGRCGAGCIGVVATPVSAAGAVGAQRTIAPTGRSPALVAAGDDYLVAYSDVRTGAHDLYASRVDAGGELVSAEIELATAPSSQVLPAIASDGDGGFLVVWQDLRNAAVELYGARIDAGGAVLDPGGALVASAARWQDRPALAFVGGAYLLAWSRGADDVPDVELRTAVIDPATGAVAEPVVVAVSPSAESSPVYDDKHPALAALGDEPVLAWQERPETAVYGRVLDAAGAPLSAEPVALAAEPAP